MTAKTIGRAGFGQGQAALCTQSTKAAKSVNQRLLARRGYYPDWLETFAHSFLEGLPGAARAEYLREVGAVLEPQLRDTTGTRVADYVRLRFAATKVDAAAAV
jgi:hypothetical protein